MGFAHGNKLTPRQMLARKERREKIINAVECPECGAKISHNCVGRKNRRALHKARTNAYKAYLASLK